MPYQKSIMTAQEELIEQIENILKADLGFLAPIYGPRPCHFTLEKGGVGKGLGRY